MLVQSRIFLRKGNRKGFIVHTQ